MLDAPSTNLVCLTRALSESVCFAWPWLLGARTLLDATNGAGILTNGAIGRYGPCLLRFARTCPCLLGVSVSWPRRGGPWPGLCVVFIHVALLSPPCLASPLSLRTASFFSIAMNATVMPHFKFDTILFQKCVCCLHVLLNQLEAIGI